MATARAGCIL